MIDREWLEARSAELASLFESRLKLRGRDLEAQLGRAGRRLPYRVRRDAETVVEAQRLAGHPKLAPQLDADRIEAACDRCERWLGGVDLKARRVDRLVQILAGALFNLLLVAAAFVAYLFWAGHV